MKTIQLLAVLLMLSLQGVAQINITQSGSNTSPSKPGAVFMDAEEGAKDEKTKDDSLTSMRLALKNFDYHSLSGFLTTGLQNEIEDLKKCLDKYTVVFNSQGEVYFKDNISDGFSRAGTSGYSKFTNTNREIGTLELKYSYKGKHPKINEILIIRNGKVKHEFPLVFSKAKQLKREIRTQSESKQYKVVIEKYKALIELSRHLENYYDNPNDGLTEKSNNYGSIAWYYAITNQPDLAIENAKKGLEIWSHNDWINTNLALGYALKNDYEKALKIYSDMGNKKYGYDKYYKTAFIYDLKRLKTEKVEVPRYADYMELLENM